MFDRYFVRYYVVGSQEAKNIDRYLAKCKYRVFIYTRGEITSAMHSKETSVWQLWLFK